MIAELTNLPMMGPKYVILYSKTTGDVVGFWSYIDEATHNIATATTDGYLTLDGEVVAIFAAGIGEKLDVIAVPSYTDTEAYMKVFVVDNTTGPTDIGYGSPGSRDPYYPYEV